MAAALGTTRGQCAGKHLHVSAHVARNSDRGVQSQTWGPACEGGCTDRGRMCTGHLWGNESMIGLTETMISTI